MDSTNSFGVRLGFVLDTAIIIVVIAVAYSLFSQWVTRRLGNPERSKEIQKKMNEVSKRLQEAAKAGDKPAEEAAMKEQAALMSEFSSAMVDQLKPMIVIIPAFIVMQAVFRGVHSPDVFGFVVPLELDALEMFQKFTIDVIIPVLNIPFGVPFFHPSSTYGPFGWFVLSAVFIGMAAFYALAEVEKRAGRKFL